MRALGFDTSNYTTSVAEFHGVGGENCSRLLDVKPGELGLRQSDALFAHVRRLPELVDALCGKLPADTVRAVGASTRPRAVEGSYMPCFLAGESQARNLARFLDVPFYPFSHQQGHIAAALWSAGRMELMRQPHLAWHLSGGTTELLLVTPDGKNVRAEKLGGTSDISAGQLIDRTGQLLGVPRLRPEGLLQGQDECADVFSFRCGKQGPAVPRGRRFLRGDGALCASHRCPRRHGRDARGAQTISGLFGRFLRRRFRQFAPARALPRV